MRTEQRFLDGFIERKRVNLSFFNLFFSSHSDTFDRTHSWTHASPLIEPPVLAGANQVLATPVVRVLVEDPVTVHHVAGGDVGGAETLQQGGAVVGQLNHLASELWPLVDHHPVGALVLLREMFISQQSIYLFMFVKEAVVLKPTVGIMRHERTQSLNPIQRW